MNKKTIDGIRGYYDLPDSVTNEQIETDLKSSFGEAVVSLNIATKDFKKAFGEAMPKVFKKYFKI